MSSDSLNVDATSATKIGIAGQRIRLRLVREVALHRVAQLVGQRADVGVLAVVVDQHVRVDVVRAAVRIGARALAVVRQQVDPALVERALDHRRVVRPERRDGAEHVLLRLLGRVFELHRRHERRVEIVVVQLVDAHHPLAKLQVAVERRQVPVHAVDEARVDRHRNVRAVERRLERRRILPRLRVEQHLLHFAVHRRAERAAEAAERPEERRHHLLAIGAVRQRAQVGERRLIELHRRGRRSA